MNLPRVSLVALSIAGAACGAGDRPLTPPGSADCALSAADGSCAGVLQPEICTDPFCTEDASCARAWYVNAVATAGGDGTIDRPLATLGAAVARARPGDCIAVAAGRYEGGLTLPATVSLLGKGASAVTIASPSSTMPVLHVGPGPGGLLRGFTITGEGRGVAASGARGLRLAELRIDGVRDIGVGGLGASDLVLEHVEIGGVRPTIAGASGVGLFLADGATALAQGCAVVDSAAQGVLVYEATLRLVASRVEQSAAGGIAIVCRRDASCGAIGTEIASTSVERNGGFGLLAIGGRIALRRSDVGYTRVHGGSARGVELAGSLVEIEESTIHHGASIGLLLHESSGKIVRSRVESNDERGVWVQNTSGPLLLEENEVVDNRKAGIGVARSQRVTIRRGRIAHTHRMASPDGAGIAWIGDGLQVLDGSEVTVLGVTIEDNDRVGALVDASAATITGCTIGGGEAGIVVQRASLDGQRLEDNHQPDGGPVQPTQIASGEEYPGIPCSAGATVPERPSE